METIKNRVNHILENHDFMEHPKFPRNNLLIEVTNYCNNKCLFCANRKMTRRRAYIDDKIVEKALKECYELGTREVGFYATGEPLINKKLEKYIARAKEIGYQYVYLTTNGILADETRLNKLLESGVDSLKFSINAIDRQTYQKIHGTDNFNLVIKNLKTAYQLKKEKYHNVKISVSYIMTKYSIQTTEKIQEFFKNRADEVISSMAKNQGGLIQEIDYLVENTKNMKAPCFYVFRSINITCEGYITACCMDFQNYLAYDDINKISIKDAWCNEKITELRKKHLCHNIKNTICENCINGTFQEVKPIDNKLATEFCEYQLDLPNDLLKMKGG